MFNHTNTYSNQTPPKQFRLIKCLSSRVFKSKKIYIKCAQNSRWTFSVYQQSLCNVWIYRNENCLSIPIWKLQSEALHRPYNNVDLALFEESVTLSASLSFLVYLFSIAKIVFIHKNFRMPSSNVPKQS